MEMEMCGVCGSEMVGVCGSFRCPKCYVREMMAEPYRYHVGPVFEMRYDESKHRMVPVMVGRG